MFPVISAWLALFSSLFRSRWALHPQVLALQHQVAVYQQTINWPRLSPMDRVFWSGWQDVLAFVQTTYCYRLATAALPRPLATAEPARATRPSRRCKRNEGPDSRHVTG
jgi:hypothetical protein